MLHNNNSSSQGSRRGGEGLTAFLLLRRLPLLLLLVVLVVIIGSSRSATHVHVEASNSSNNSSLTNTTVKKVLCALPIVEWTRMASHPYYAATFYASKFPQIEWSGKYVNIYPGTSADMARGWVVNGTDCDALIGPGFSSRAITISPIVDIPWVDVSTSTELSDKTNHPTFMRSIPTDTVVAKAAGLVYQQFGWNATNIICIDESHGRSVAQGVTDAMYEANGTVDIAVCLERTASQDKVSTLFDQFYASKTRVIFNVALGELLEKFSVECALRNCTKDFIIFFAEGSCPYELPQWPGALCATAFIDPTAMGPFLEGYYNRDLTEEREQLASLGWPADTDIADTTGHYAQFAHDAAHHVMSALHEHYVTGSTLEIIDFVRDHESQGATGRINLDENGDRSAVDVVVYNNNMTSDWNIIGLIKDSVFNFADGNANVLLETSKRPDLVLLDTIFTASDSIPSGVTASDASGDTIVRVTTTNRSGLYVGIIIGVLAVLIVLVVVLLAGRQVSKAGRDTSAAPKDPSEPFTIVFTDIQSSTSLWARIPEKMAEAVDTHHEIIRNLIKEHRGYEVKTIGDSFMVAFMDTNDAINFSINLQSRFYQHDWNTPLSLDDSVEGEEGPVSNPGGRGGGPVKSLTIDDVYDQLQQERLKEENPAYQLLASTMCESGNPLLGYSGSSRSALLSAVPSALLSADEDHEGREESSGGGGKSLLWNGLRVRVAIHWGYGDVKYDLVTQGFDYYGTTVNTAARVEGVAHGGQVLITKPALDEALANTTTGGGKGGCLAAAKMTIKDLGPQPLRGIDTPLHLHQLVPPRLAGRGFETLRLGVEHHPEGVDSESGSSDGGGSLRSHSHAANANITPEVLAERYLSRMKLAAPPAGTPRQGLLGSPTFKVFGGIAVEMMSRENSPRNVPANEDLRVASSSGPGCAASNEPKGYNDIMWSYYVAKALFSTSNDKMKRDTLDHWAKKWHVSLSKSRDKKMTPKTQWDQDLMKLVLRVTPTAEARVHEATRVHEVQRQNASNSSVAQPLPKGNSVDIKEQQAIQASSTNLFFATSLGQIDDGILDDSSTGRVVPLAIEAQHDDGDDDMC